MLYFIFLNPKTSLPGHYPIPCVVCASSYNDPNGSFGMSGLTCQEGFDKTLAVSIGSMSKEIRACMSFTLLFSLLGVYLRGLILFSVELVSLTTEINRNKSQKCHLLKKNVVFACTNALVWELREAL